MDQEPFDPSFMDDYFAEADEHIGTVKRGLLALESALDGTLPPAVLEELFRSFHTLKALSAMVDLREAEVLSHELESCFRRLQRGEMSLRATEFDALLDGVSVIEKVVAARRAAMPIPDVSAALHALRGVTAPPSASASETKAHPASSGTPEWKVTFVPSPELIARGVKVDTIRARLLEIGAILGVTPTVLAGGGISFDFHLQTADQNRLAALAPDGVTYAPLLVTSPAPEAVLDPLRQPVPVAPAAADSGAGLTTFVRVELSRLDDLMRLVGDLVVTRSRLEDTLDRVERHVPATEHRLLQEHSGLMERQLRDIREGVMRVRLVSVAEIFKRMPFVVRDLARDSGKRVRLELAGQGTEIDKLLIERMMDPILHLVRNAASHGIESPERRIASGKSPEGVIRLSATTAGDSVVLEIADDGAGIDIEAVAARARASGMVLPDESDPRAILDIICASGFSTREEADRASGRGIGMAVVRQTVQDLGGTLAVDTHPDRGTAFTITLPLTLAITDAVIVHVADRVFAVPQAAVRELIEVDAATVQAMERNALIAYRTASLPVTHLADVFGLTRTVRSRFHALVIGTGLSAVGLLVDRVVGQREIVVKTIHDPLIRVEGVSGATELGDGRLVLIIDVIAVSRRLRNRPRPAQAVERAIV